MKNLISQFVMDESGAGAIEYALIVLLAIAIVSLIGIFLKSQVTNMTSTIANRLGALINNLS